MKIYTFFNESGDVIERIPAKDRDSAIKRANLGRHTDEINFQTDYDSFEISNPCDDF